MATPLNIVAQQAMDMYYEQYKNDNTDFFGLVDFVLYCGNVISSIYNQYYIEQYKEIKAERKEEVVTFDIGMLDEMLLDVYDGDNGLFAKYTNPVFTFPYDKSNTAIQNVLPVSPKDIYEYERSSINNFWQLQYIPITNKMFFIPERTGIKFFTNGLPNVNKVRVLYVPSVSSTMNVPEGVVDTAIQKTVTMMRELGKGNVVKKSLDGNDNKIPQTEINPHSLK
jgi:hypothetical protein